MSYIIGSIPSAVWIGKSMYGVDVREKGSKNAGATNTFRVLGSKAGIIVLLIDIVKGILAVYLTEVFISYQLLSLTLNKILLFKLIAGFGAFIGHLFPIFASFRGGKGVATTLGIILSIQTNAAVICLLIFLMVFLVSKYVSLGAIIASFSFPFVVSFILQEKSSYLIVFSVFISFTVIFAHRNNIIRLIKGEENKMNLFRN